jgi:hypothetical protein
LERIYRFVLSSSFEDGLVLVVEHEAIRTTREKKTRARDTVMDPKTVPRAAPLEFLYLPRAGPSPLVVAHLPSAAMGH